MSCLYACPVVDCRTCLLPCFAAAAAAVESPNEHLQVKPKVVAAKKAAKKEESSDDDSSSEEESSEEEVSMYTALTPAKITAVLSLTTTTAALSCLHRFGWPWGDYFGHSAIVVRIDLVVAGYGEVSQPQDLK